MVLKIYLTAGGLLRLRRRATDARAAYLRVCADNPEALESGDTSGWHDNFAFEENQRQMHRLARHVRDLEELLHRVEVVVPVRRPPERAYIGTRVVWRIGNDPEQTGWLAGWDDGDPERGRVSYNSPLGTAILSGEPGDVREVMLGGVVREVEIVSVTELDPAEDADA